MHLFDIELEGQKPIRESAVFSRGLSGKLRDFNGWRVGESICYDMRFSELYSGYAYAQADLVLVPSAFLVETGRAHWEILLRARAIESQCYVVASAQVGTHNSTKSQAERRTFGHSLAIDPWGNIEADLGESEGVRIVHLSKDKIRKVREQIPMVNHRRGVRESQT
jgi:predicted amidohydrolase